VFSSIGSCVLLPEIRSLSHSSPVTHSGPLHREGTPGSFSVEKDELPDLLRRALESARVKGRSVLTSFSTAMRSIDCLAFLAAIESDEFGNEYDDILRGPRMYWSRAADEFEFVGIGATVNIVPGSADRFAGVDDEWHQLLNEEVGNASGSGGAALMGGFSFDPSVPSTERWSQFPDALFLVPWIQIATQGETSWLTINTLVSPHDTLDENLASMAGAQALVEKIAVRARAGERTNNVRGGIVYENARTEADWRAMINDAIAEIRAGAFEKVVLAREVRATAQTGLDVVSVLEHLRQAHADCYVFGIWSGDSVFAGATPERLVRLDGREVKASSLAGSVRRGKTDEEDAALARGLLESAKDRREHEIVRRVLVAGLSKLCDDVSADDTPSILSLPQVHHLHTGIRATLRNDHSLLELIGEIHPTPAVGGEPSERALAFIREHEKLDRGWYAAPVGWMQRDRGEFAVALRSAVITGSEASLFAGCGVVRDSTPEEEYAESLLKLEPIQLALAASLDGGVVS